MSQQPIVRHYHGATRADVEAAYRADAGPAISAGYIPVGHIWSHDAYGLLLAVSYQAQAAPVPSGYAAAAQPAQPSQYARPQHPAQFAPASNGHYPQPTPAVQPPQRYSPLPEMYQVPPDMYAPANQVAAPAAPSTPVAPAVAPVLTAPAPMPAAQPAPDYDKGASRPTRLTIQTMDLHAAGEPLRIIRSGFPDVPHMPVLERRRWVLENADYVRRAIIQEPRGHRDMYGAILLPPYNDYADMTVLFMHNEGYSTMCGHGIIAITTGLIEEGLFPATGPVTTIRYEVPAGIVAANAATVQLEDGSWAVRGVRFTNVPSYLAAQSLAVRPDGLQLYGPSAQYGALSVDIAFGGAYYGIVNAADLGLRVVPEQAEALRHAGAAITNILRRDHTPQHPTDPALGFIYGTIIVDMDPRSAPDGRAGDAHLRNVTVFADAEVDRSPCGSGTSALLAQLHARGRMRVGQEIVNAGITGEHFLGRIEAETALGPYRAVSTSIAGTAYVTGYSTFVVDSRDPLGDGFLLS
ncbi:MAG: proline racemase family protein [Candidatus Limnocylindrales bacterium]